MMTPTLIQLTPSYRESFLDYMDDFRRAGELDYVDDTVNAQTFSEFLDRLHRESAGIDLKPGIVPSTTWFLFDGQLILGRVSIRHWLTPRLEDFGGHIGYDVRPSCRGKGYGSLILHQALTKARELGLTKVLLTCNPANIPSVRTILKNGGKLASESAAVTAKNRPTQRYWIDITPISDKNPHI
jgi:predicted acetyltransferase